MQRRIIRKVSRLSSTSICNSYCCSDFEGLHQRKHLRAIGSLSFLKKISSIVKGTFTTGNVPAEPARIPALSSLLENFNRSNKDRSKDDSAKSAKSKGMGGPLKFGADNKLPVSSSPWFGESVQSAGEDSIGEGSIGEGRIGEDSIGEDSIGEDSIERDMGRGSMDKKGKDQTGTAALVVFVAAKDEKLKDDKGKSKKVADSVSTAVSTVVADTKQLESNARVRVRRCPQSLPNDDIAMIKETASKVMNDHQKDASVLFQLLDLLSLHRVWDLAAWEPVFLALENRLELDALEQAAERIALGLEHAVKEISGENEVDREYKKRMLGKVDVEDDANSKWDRRKKVLEAERIRTIEEKRRAYPGHHLRTEFLSMTGRTDDSSPGPLPPLCAAVVWLKTDKSAIPSSDLPSLATLLLDASVAGARRSVEEEKIRKSSTFWETVLNPAATEVIEELRRRQFAHVDEFIEASTTRRIRDKQTRRDFLDAPREPRKSLSDCLEMLQLVSDSTTPASKASKDDFISFLGSVSLRGATSELLRFFSILDRCVPFQRAMDHFPVSYTLTAILKDPKEESEYHSASLEQKLHLSRAAAEYIIAGCPLSEKQHILKLVAAIVKKFYLRNSHHVEKRTLKKSRVRKPDLNKNVSRTTIRVQASNSRDKSIFRSPFLRSYRLRLFYDDVNCLLETCWYMMLYDPTYFVKMSRPIAVWAEGLLPDLLPHLTKFSVKFLDESLRKLVDDQNFFQAHLPRHILSMSADQLNEFVGSHTKSAQELCRFIVRKQKNIILTAERFRQESSPECAETSLVPVTDNKRLSTKIDRSSPRPGGVGGGVGGGVQILTARILQERAAEAARRSTTEKTTVSSPNNLQSAPSVANPNGAPPSKVLKLRLTGRRGTTGTPVLMAMDSNVVLRIKRKSHRISEEDILKRLTVFANILCLAEKAKLTGDYLATCFSLIGKYIPKVPRWTCSEETSFTFSRCVLGVTKLRIIHSRFLEPFLYRGVLNNDPVILRHIATKPTNYLPWLARVFSDRKRKGRLLQECPITRLTRNLTTFFFNRAAMTVCSAAYNATMEEIEYRCYRIGEALKGEGSAKDKSFSDRISGPAVLEIVDALLGPTDSLPREKTLWTALPQLDAAVVDLMRHRNLIMGFTPNEMGSEKAFVAKIFDRTHRLAETATRVSNQLKFLRGLKKPFTAEVHHFTFAQNAQPTHLSKLRFRKRHRRPPHMRVPAHDAASYIQPQDVHCLQTDYANRMEEPQHISGVFELAFRVPSEKRRKALKGWNTQYASV